MTFQEDTIDFGDTRITYTVRRSKRRKTVGIALAPDGRVEVIAPPGYSSRQIAETVRSKCAWIVRKQDESRDISKTPHRDPIGDEPVLYLGRRLRFELVPDDVPDVRLRFIGKRLEVRTPLAWPKIRRRAAAKKALRNWYRSRLETIAVPMADRLASQVGEAYSTIRMRDLGHRWGSCGKGRVLYLNWRLAMAPKRLIEFVVAHEVCHLIHPDHSRNFFRLLTRILPDWETRQQRLDREGARFDL